MIKGHLAQKRSGLKILPVFFLILASHAKCNNIYYIFEPIKPPVNLVATKEITPVSHTRLKMNAYNTEYDFTGYAVYTGATQSEALAQSAYVLCEFTENNTLLTRSTLIQHGGGGTVVSGYDCSLAGATPELVAGDWVAVRALGSRDCTDYPGVAECTNRSEAAVTQVLSYIEPPAAATITQPEGQSYYLLSVTLPASIPVGFSGLGIFSGATKNEAVEKAGLSTDSADYFCTFGALSGGQVLSIQLGGQSAQAGVDCHASTMTLYSGEHLAVRNAITRSVGQYPWSSAVNVSVP